jgi:hypothetical protein
MVLFRIRTIPLGVVYAVSMGITLSASYAAQKEKASKKFRGLFLKHVIKGINQG